jgi:copper(I)-binding protein
LPARYLLSFAAALLVSTAALGTDLQISDAWVRGTVPAQRASGAFMRITSPAGATLLGVSSPVAETVELHEMSMSDGMMRMRPITRLELPAGKAIELRPGGYHIMLMGLKQPLATGSSVPLTLRVEHNGKEESLAVEVPVRSLTATPGTPGASR